MLGGADHVLMATDDPYQRRVADGAARAFLRSAAISSEDRTKMAHGNAERLGLHPGAGSSTQSALDADDR